MYIHALSKVVYTVSVYTTGTIMVYAVSVYTVNWYMQCPYNNTTGI